MIKIIFERNEAHSKTLTTDLMVLAMVYSSAKSVTNF